MCKPDNEACLARASSGIYKIKVTLLTFHNYPDIGQPKELILPFSVS